MLKQIQLLRFVSLKQLLNKPPPSVAGHFYSTGSSDDNEDKASKAKQKLESLLQSIIKDESLAQESRKEDSPGAPMKVGKKKFVRKEAKKTLGEKLISAAKQVAEKIDGDKTATEAELLRKVLYKNAKLQESVEKSSCSQSLKNLLAGMNVETEPRRSPQQGIKEFKDDPGLSRAERVRSLLKNKRKPAEASIPRAQPSIDILVGDRLNIFSSDKLNSTGVNLDTWHECDAREMKLKVSHPPTNIWEQMIVWTDRGMLWKFPIDNEQGLDDEQKVDFSEHVFLENYIEDWCPQRGPVRHFMELVCVGLSRNHWLTAEEKKNHVLWYKEFFSSKRELLAEIGAGDIKVPQLTS